MRFLLAMLGFWPLLVSAEECLSDLRELRPYCTTVLACDRATEHASQLPPYLDFDVQRQCDLALQCQKRIGQPLCTLANERRVGPSGKWLSITQRRPDVVLDKRTLVELRKAACADDGWERVSPPEQPDPSYAATLESNAALECATSRVTTGSDPVSIPKFADALQVTQRVYNQRCNSAVGCLRWLRDNANQWQVQLANQASELELIERGQINDRINTANQMNAVHLHAQMLSAATRDAAETLGQATEAAATKIASATEKAGDAIAGAVHKDRPAAKSDADTTLQQSASNDAARQADTRSEQTADQATEAQESVRPSSLSSATQNVANEIGNAGQGTSEALVQIAQAIEFGLLGRPAPTGGVARQVDPEADFEEIYTQASVIEYGVLLVPDPRIPRHRRAYELSIHAVMRGMLAAGFVLDRYSVPWQQYLDNPKFVAPADRGGTQLVDDGKYGVLLFRRDDWRDESDGDASKRLSPPFTVRALYVVGESGSFGVQRDAFANAVGRAYWKARGLRDQTPRQQTIGTHSLSRVLGTPGVICTARVLLNRLGLSALPRVAHAFVPPLVTVVEIGFGICVESDQASGNVLVIGPAFSGSVNSIVESLSESSLNLIMHRRLSRSASKGFEELERGAQALMHALRLKNSSALARRHVAAFFSDLNRSLAKHRPRRIPLTDLTSIRDQWEARSVPRELSDLTRKLDEIYAGEIDPKVTCANSNDGSCRPKSPLYVRLVSAAATSESNAKLVRYTSDIDSSLRLGFGTFAVTDSEKLKALSLALRSRGLDETSSCGKDNKCLAIFSEASVFGNGLCSAATLKSLPEICKHAIEVHFPANIADIRHGARERERRAEAAAREALSLPDQDSLLDLAPGAENGSEFPESAQAQTTIASAELELEQAIRHIKHEVRPKVVVIAATDVRDRIFLMQRLRGELPQVLLVDLEADVLMSHPSVTHATRGALLLASHPLEFVVAPLSGIGPPSFESFSTDDQALLYCLIRSLGQHFEAFGESALELQCAEGGKSVERPQFLVATTRSLVPARDKSEELSLLTGLTLMIAALLIAIASRKIASIATAPKTSWEPERRHFLAWGLGGLAVSSLALALAWLVEWAELVDFDAMTVLLLLSAASVSSLFLGHWAMQNQVAAQRRHPWFGACLLIPLAASGAVLCVAAGMLVAMSPGLLDADLMDGVSLPLFALLVLTGIVVAAWLLCWRSDVVATVSNYALTYRNLVGVTRQLLVRYVRMPRGPIGAVAVLALAPLVAIAAWAFAAGLRSYFSEHSWWLSLTCFLATTLLALLAWAALTQAAVWLSELRRYSARLQMRVLQSQPTGTGPLRMSDWASLPTTTVVADTDGVALRWVPPFFREAPFTADERDWTPSLAFLEYNDLGFIDTVVDVSQTYRDSLKHRVVTATLAAYLIRRVRVSFYAAFVAASALILCGYAWPITARNEFLLLALGYLLLGAFGYCYALIWCERNEVLSRLVSNTPGRTDISWTFVSAFLTPFVILTLAILVLEMPGVMQWSGGLIGPILDRLGL